MSGTERRVVLYASLAAAALVVVHSLTWDALRWNGATLVADGDALVGVGAAKANLFRASLLCDLFGSYLLTLPATLALWRLLRPDADRGVVDLLAVGGVIYAVAGAVAAAVFAEAGSSLIDSYAAGTRTSAVQFASLNQAALATWQIVCVTTGGAWWLGSGVLLRRRWKWFARYSMLFGGLSVLLGALKVAGVEFESSGPATVAFLPIAGWIGWLGVHLYLDATLQLDDQVVERGGQHVGARP